MANYGAQNDTNGAHAEAPKIDQLEHKEDWAEAKARMTAWWAGDNVGRCGLAVTAPRDHGPDVPPPPGRSGLTSTPARHFGPAGSGPARPAPGPLR